MSDTARQRNDGIRVEFNVALTESLFFQRMLGRATALKSLSICIDRFSILPESVGTLKRV